MMLVYISLWGSFLTLRLGSFAAHIRPPKAIIAVMPRFRHMMLRAYDWLASDLILSI